MDPKLTQSFRRQSIADELEFIRSNLHYVSMWTFADLTRAYSRDMLDAINDPELIADWLREKGYDVKKTIK